jgi:hypothetical protein
MTLLYSYEVLQSIKCCYFDLFGNRFSYSEWPLYDRTHAFDLYPILTVAIIVFGGSTAKYCCS